MLEVVLPRILSAFQAPVASEEAPNKKNRNSILQVYDIVDGKVTFGTTRPGYREMFPAAPSSTAADMHAGRIQGRQRMPPIHPSDSAPLKRNSAVDRRVSSRTKGRLL